MAHWLDASQLAEECAAQGLTAEAAALVAAAQKAAEAIAAKRGDVMITMEADNQPGFGGLCVGFSPATEGEKCPDDFIAYDPGSDWAEESESTPCRQHRDTGRGVCADCGTFL